MESKLEERRKENISKIRIGSCIELLIILDNFENDFSRLENFIIENDMFLNNQDRSTILAEFSSILNVLTYNIDILLNDIDKEEIYSLYLSRYY